MNYTSHEVPPWRALLSQERKGAVTQGQNNIYTEWDFEIRGDIRIQYGNEEALIKGPLVLMMIELSLGVQIPYTSGKSFY